MQAKAVTVRIPADLYERLRLAAFERHVSQVSIIIKALERELAADEPIR
jgi:predicted transcriptional regulator